MFNQILVAIDHSTMSRKVFETGVSLAQTTGASLMLLHVLSSEDQDCPKAPLTKQLILSNIWGFGQ